MRILYFLRHGLADRSAYHGTDDRLRPLTPAGRRRLHRAGRNLAQAGWRPDVILTSPLTRAVQTAEIVAEEVGLLDSLEVEESLACGFGVEDLRRLLTGYADAREMVLVGHEPDFSTVVSILTGGTGLFSRIVFKKGCLARVDLLDEEGLAGKLVWLIPPKLLSSDQVLPL